jgi:deoxyribodipyrimidine photolyase-related protein
MHVFIVFPVHLFETLHPDMRKQDRIVVLEEPVYFYDKQVRPFKFHKMKLSFHRATMRAYFEKLKKRFNRSNDPSVSYVAYEDADKFYKQLKESKDHVTMYDPIDVPLVEKIRKTLAGNEVNIVEDSPAFLATRSDLQSFHRPSTRHDAFYKMMKTKLKILETTPSQDAKNRKPLPQGQRFEDKLKPYRCQHHAEAQRWMESHSSFKDHYGNLNAFDYYPVTHAQARRHLSSYMRGDKFKSFGPYQDAVKSDAAVLYHSFLSALLNCGLLTPEQVLKEAQKAYKRKHIPLETFEGFVRQLIGWREYMRYLYAFHYDEIHGANRYGKLNSRTITNKKEWYEGKTGIAIVDKEIHKAMELGYAHHIVRLMIFLNVMSLCGVHPSNIVQWFMEVVSMDAYDWIMWSNISAMGGFTNRFMSKPYISTTNYIHQMSDYPKHPSDSIWDSLFYYRILTGNKYYGSVYGRNLHHFNSKTSKQKETIAKQAKQFIAKMTNKM